MRKMVFLLLVVACLLLIGVNMTVVKSPVEGVEDNILYAGVLSSPGKVLKIDLNTFQIVDRMTLDAGEDRVHAVASNNKYLYVGVLTSPAQIIQIRLSDFTRVNKVTLPSGLDKPVSLEIWGNYLYAGLASGHLARMDTGTLEVIDYIDLDDDTPAGGLVEGVLQEGDFLYVNVEAREENIPWIKKLKVSDLSLVDKIQPSKRTIRWSIVDGNYLYVVFSSGMCKIDLATFNEVDAITFPTGKLDFVVKYEDYFYTNGDTSPGRVHKVRISDFTWVDSLDLSERRSCDLELSEHYLYVSTLITPSKIIKVDLDTFQEVAKLDTGERLIAQMAIIPKTEVSPTPTPTLSPTPTPTPTESITITGIVTEEKIEDPIIGALVRADGYSNTTDSAGRYALMVPPGIYTVTASAPGYKESSQIVDARIEGTYRVNLTLATPEDSIPPRISHITIQPSYPSPHDEAAVTCAVTDDESGVKEVTLYYSTDDEIYWNRVSMTYVGDLYKATIPRQKEGITVRYFIEALDNSLNREKSNISSYTIKAPRYPFPGKEATVGLIVFIFVISIVVWFVSKRRRPLNFS